MGSASNALVRVRHRDYVLDMRSVGSAARAWLLGARPARGIGAACPDGIALARGHGVRGRPHRVAAARLRDR